MPGYAYPVGAVNSDTGTATSVTAVIDAANDLVTIFTATQKTRVNAVLASNDLGTIVPVDLYVYRDSEDENYFFGKTRVLKSKYLVLPLVSGDSRVDELVADPKANKIATEFVLQIGDALKASCPIADAVNVTANLTEGVK